MSKVRFFKCEVCGNLVAVVNDSGAPMSCCGRPMTELKPNTTDAAQEKHVPVVEVSGTSVKVAVGSVAHPMLAEHYIMWICLETDKGTMLRHLEPGSAPAAEFTLQPGEKGLTAYAFCNLHGLWAKEI
ncbi:MAG: desulfoferrodoxin [Lachnospiraceae bacterium]|jgi:superoxide reductase|nr:desulfoferrodoxin [Lachnospiraceae bacterium]